MKKTEADIFTFGFDITKPETKVHGYSFSSKQIVVLNLLNFIELIKKFQRHMNWL